MRLFTDSNPASIFVNSSFRSALISERNAANPMVSTPKIAAVNTAMSVHTWGSVNVITSLL